MGQAHEVGNNVREEPRHTVYVSKAQRAETMDPSAPPEKSSGCAILLCMQLTRRKLALALLVPAASAQAPAPVDEVQAARDRIKTNGEALTKVDLPMSTEPAFQFKA